MSSLSAVDRYKEDSGTELESLDAIRASYPSRDFRTAIEPCPSEKSGSSADLDTTSPCDVPFAPVLRPPTPRLTLLDDGDLEQGEMVRLRDAVTVIGRLHGQILLPHDNVVSGKHAEIIREGKAAPYRWILRDLGSSNGTFVSCTKAILTPDRAVILGSRRFRFQPPTEQAGNRQQPAGTALYDARSLGNEAWPSLVEITGSSKPMEIPLRASRLSVGRPGNGNEIELDDPLISRQHALIAADSSGQWTIAAGRSKNGVWIQINAVRLTGLCRFQCGEQRFLFVLQPRS